MQNLAASEIVGCSELILIYGRISFCSGRVIILSINLYVCLLTFADEVWISLVVLLLEISCCSLQSDVSPFPLPCVSRAEASPTQICFWLASLPSLYIPMYLWFWASLMGCWCLMSYFVILVNRLFSCTEITTDGPSLKIHCFRGSQQTCASLF